MTLTRPVATLSRSRERGAVRRLAEVGGVGLPTELVPVAGEDALAARALEGNPETADAAEEVDEAGRL